LKEDAADLRPVAVSDDDLPPGGRDVGDALRGLARGAVHLLEGVLLPAAEQRVAAERDRDAFHGAPLSLGGPVRAPRAPSWSPRSPGARSRRERPAWRCRSGDGGRSAWRSRRGR